MPEVVDPRWLLKALGISLGVAAILGYLSVCLLVYLGGWQLMLRPIAKIDVTPSAPYQSIRFDAASTGSPRLTGWWIPAENAAPTTPTILYLHDGSGSLSSIVRKLNLLHMAQANVFALDYRGYGQSSPPHPTEAHMAEDSAAALEYLTETRHLPASTIVPYGEGLGAVLAANLASSHAEIPALIVDTPDPQAFARATGEGKARLLPMRLLVQEHFDLAEALAASHKPKLLLVDGPFGYDSQRTRENNAAFRNAPDPKTTVTFGKVGAENEYVAAVTRFLDEYLPHSQAVAARSSR